MSSSPRGVLSPRRQARLISSPLIRQNTRGPLDEADDPLSRSTLPSSTSPGPAPPQNDSLLGPAILSSPSSSPIPIAIRTEKDLSFLLRTDTYHPLSNLDLPPPFREPAPPSTTHHELIPTLLARGRFRAAATVAASNLTSIPRPTSPDLIFSLLYTRLTCLICIGAGALAAQESKVLGDLASPFWIDESTGLNFLPWELRVLGTRLQGRAFGDAKRSIVGYFALARECRVLLKSGELASGERALWKGRLEELGVFIASALVEMGDLDGARRQLETMATTQGEENHARLALVNLRMGNLHRAKSHVEHAMAYADFLDPLLDLARGEYAVGFEKSQSRSRGSDLAVQANEAVLQLYTGQLPEARACLEGLLAEGHAVSTILYNVANMLELSTDRAKVLKTELCERLAEQPGSSVGWERSAGEMKL